MSVKFVRAREERRIESSRVVQELYAGLSSPKQRRARSVVKHEVIDLDTDDLDVLEVIPSPAVRKPAPKLSFRKERPAKPLELLRAAQDGDIDGIKSCLKRGADVDATDAFGWTPLMCAIQAGRKEAIKTLVDLGRANVHIRNNQGKTAFDMALANRRSDFIEFLVRGGKGRKRKNEFISPDSITSASELSPAVAPKQECSVCGQTEISMAKWHEHVASVVHQLALESQPSSSEPLGQPPFKIPESNVGYQLLVKSGWDARSGLGKHGTGRKMPLRVTRKTDRRGLGEKRSKLTEPTEEANAERRLKRVIEERARCEKGQERKMREMLSGI